MSEWEAGEKRMAEIGRNGNDGIAYPEAGKQPRYQDAKGEDWIDEFARTATAEEFRGALCASPSVSTTAAWARKTI